MRVFISWSGERSRSLALAIKDWLPLVIGYVEPWVSDADIDAGDRWGQSVASELSQSNFGILCVTSENVSSPWVLFEAGALAKSLDDSKVIPLLFDLEFSDISGPLAQFQAKKVDRVGIREVVASIQRSAEEPIADPRLEKLFDALWGDLETSVGSISREPPDERHTRPHHEVLEELVASVRSLDGRFRDSEDMFGGPRRIRRSLRRSPMILRELGSLLGGDPDDPIGILILAAYIREDAPWFYELAMDAYRAVRSGNIGEIERAVTRLERMTDVLMRGPFLEELGADPMSFEAIMQIRRHFDRSWHGGMNRIPPDGGEHLG